MRKFTAIRNWEPRVRVSGFADLAAEHVVKVLGPSIPLLCNSRHRLPPQAQSKRAEGPLGIISRHDRVKRKEQSHLPMERGNLSRNIHTPRHLMRAAPPRHPPTPDLAEEQENGDRLRLMRRGEGRQDRCWANATSAVHTAILPRGPSLQPLREGRRWGRD